MGTAKNLSLNDVKDIMENKVNPNKLNTKDTSSISDFTLDDILTTLNLGSIERASSNNLYGINHRAIPGLIPSNKDSYGLVFFTRPQLNMQDINIRNVRRFYPLLSDIPSSIQRYVRSMLDPRLSLGVNFGSISYPALSSSLVDPKQAFIPLLTNNIIRMSGWPDIVAPTFTSEAGHYNESYSQVDGTTEMYETFDMDVTFRNVKGDPGLLLFYVWTHYSSLVFSGELVPYWDFITENEIDYNTRIYRLVLDSTRRYVTKISATGASYPYTANINRFFDFDSDKPLSEENKELPIRFRCMGADYLDDVLVYEYNETVGIFNPEMRNHLRKKTMTKIPNEYLTLFNHRGYPRIDPNTRELQWWIDKSIYNAYGKKFFKYMNDTHIQK